MVLRWILSRVRRPHPIVVVSGLPRSGTSMMMRMLQLGGMDVACDNIRKKDEDNPRGYFELERVKSLKGDGDKSWLGETPRKAVKVISFLLSDLPDEFNYKIIFVHRHIDEILASQSRMLEHRSETNKTSDEDMKSAYAAHLKDVESFLKSKPNFDSFDVQYDHVIRDPETHAKKINEFLGGALDVSSMTAAVEPDLYRNRIASS